VSRDRSCFSSTLRLCSFLLVPSHFAASYPIPRTRYIGSIDK
jgi:hypothetical protein